MSFLLLSIFECWSKEILVHTYIMQGKGLVNNLPTNQLAVSQVAD